MSRYLRPERIEQAILNLADWRTKVQAQASSHLVSLLAMTEKGVNRREWKKYEEDDDKEFFDKYFRVDEPSRADKPYFDPLTRTRRIDTHPHSNVATARKSTFARSWNAVSTRRAANGDNEWKLAEDFGEIVRSRVMTKGGVTQRPNVLDFAVWMFRSHEFDDAASSESLKVLFATRFSLDADTFDELFVFEEESPEELFQGTLVQEREIQDIIKRIEAGTDAPPKLIPTAPSKEQATILTDDPTYQEITALLQLGTSGVILRGCPGTGKSWLAWQIALKLTDNNVERIERVQFHSAFGYEDFVEGYRPNEQAKSGFEVVEKLFLNFARRAQNSGELHVLVIDEINRGDPSRIFGEILTYIEEGWRNIEFRTPFRNEKVSIPKNLFVLATMNPHDRSTTPLDMAMLRRFDHIDIMPSSELVETFLSEAGFPEDKGRFVVEWFDTLQKLLPFGIGHAYFRKASSINALRKIYRYRIEPYCRALLELEGDKLDGVIASFAALEQRLHSTSSSP